MLQVKIKASSVRNLTDARYFAAREVEWIGFPLQPGQEDAITPATAKSIIEWIDGVKVIGEFEFLPAEEILEMHHQIWFDAIQVGMFTSQEELKKLSELTLIQEVVVEKSTTADELSKHFSANAAYCDFFLLNFEKTGLTWKFLLENEALPLDFLKKITKQYSMIVSLDFSKENLREILNTMQPYGISLAGGAEEKVGVKSFDELDDIFDRLELPE